jgi:hypothetical protein
VCVRAQYAEGTDAPFIVLHDSPGLGMKTILDNLIHQKRIPPVVVISVANGGDAQGHERGREYDNMSGDYAEYVETEITVASEEELRGQPRRQEPHYVAAGTSPQTADVSRRGGAPNIRRYSLPNCDGLSYPTRNAASPASAPEPPQGSWTRS